MSTDFHWDPANYLEQVRSEIPGFDRLQEAVVAAVPFAPARILDLGVGTGETSRRLLDSYPEAAITGLDSDPEMIFRARKLGIEVKLARMEDPLPDGPWDLVVAVLSVSRLDPAGKQDLMRRVREEADALVIGDLVAPRAGEGDQPESAAALAALAAGEVVTEFDGLAVVAADYRGSVRGGE